VAGPFGICSGSAADGGVGRSEMNKDIDDQL